MCPAAGLGRPGRGEYPTHAGLCGVPSAAQGPHVSSLVSGTPWRPERAMEEGDTGPMGLLSTRVAELLPGTPISPVERNLKRHHDAYYVVCPQPHAPRTSVVPIPPWSAVSLHRPRVPPRPTWGGNRQFRHDTPSNLSQPFGSSQFWRCKSCCFRGFQHHDLCFPEVGPNTGS